MQFLALATDYDGTIAHDGTVPDSTLQALQRLKHSGRRLIMVTGRELADLVRVFPAIEVFDRIVAENGALLYTPATKEARPLGPPPPREFVERLQAKHIAPLSVGQVIVATWEPNEGVVLDTIREFGLDLQIIFNKGAVMVLPSGINKASGLHAALDDLGLLPLNVVAVGDAENDLAFMRFCGAAVAVSNGLEAVRSAADLTTKQPRGAGVEELVELMVEAEADLLAAAIGRHCVAIGTDESGQQRFVRPQAGHVLIAGTSGGGKSTLATGLLERMGEAGAQFCIFDPEGDYAGLESAVVFGDAKTVPRPESVFAALAAPVTNVVVNMLGLDVADRPRLFAKFYPLVLQQRAATGRPHWCLIDEAHHMLPRGRGTDGVLGSVAEPSVILVTVHPESLAPDVLREIGCVLGIGDSAGDVVAEVAKALGRRCPDLPDRAPAQGETLVWDVRSDEPACIVTIEGPKQAQKRHTRKYAEGALGEDKSFYFRGADGKLNLRAQNLMVFLQMADGVDEATFLHHLRQGDYSTWFRNAIKDRDLAQAMEGLEQSDSESATEVRALLRALVEARYTAPAEGAA